MFRYYVWKLHNWREGLLEQAGNSEQVQTKEAQKKNGCFRTNVLMEFPTLIYF